jgi:molecular chaperone GrpE
LASHKQHKDKDFAEGGFAAAAGAAEGSAAADQATPEALLAGEASAAEQIQKLVEEKQDLQNTLLRRQADFENYRKRVERERAQERHRGAELLIEQVLPVLDAFDLALAGQSGAASAEYRKGFEIIRAQLWNALAKQGLQPIEAVGKPFDPNLHHAIENVPTASQPEGTVVGEMQTGYMFHGRVLRPAMVRVASAPAN